MPEIQPAGFVSRIIQLFLLAFRQTIHVVQAGSGKLTEQFCLSYPCSGVSWLQFRINLLTEKLQLAEQRTVECL